MQPYKQTTLYTFAAASLASTINHFKPDFLLNVENEFDIWHKTATLPTRGSSIYALAIYAFEKGIPVRVVVGEHEYKFPGYKFRAYKKKEIEIANFSSQLFYTKAKSLGISVEERQFDLNEVKELIKDNKVVMLRLIIGIVRGSDKNKRNPHYLPVYGYEDGCFLLLDSHRGPLRVKESVVQEAFEKVDDVDRDNRMIIFG